MKDGFARAAAAGAAGAAALTGVHQLALGLTEAAPRMDILGMRALKRSMRTAGLQPPRGRTLYNWTLAGDLLSNGAYYSLVAGPRPWMRGAVLGLAAGAGALLLPQRIGLGHPPKSEYVTNQVMTVAWYLLGGLVAAATAARLQRRSQEP
jgi:hypothetical protein